MGLSEQSSHAASYSANPLKPSSTTGKRKRNATTDVRTAVSDEADPDTEYLAPIKPKKRSPKKSKEEEKRLRRYRSHAPSSYLEKLSRATTQRMFIIDRSRDDEALEETIDMAGSTGNVYKVTIGLEPSCTCPDNQNGNQCKHIVYVRTQPVAMTSWMIVSLLCRPGPPQRPQSSSSSPIPTRVPHHRTPTHFFQRPMLIPVILGSNQYRILKSQICRRRLPHLLHPVRPRGGRDSILPCCLR